jgi:hypothetical protein
MTKESKKETLEERLGKLHEKFLDDIKEVYPLAVLGSLCIAIAAFTKDSYPQAQAFAIVAASMFLMGFVFSFAQKIIKSDYTAFFAIGSTTTAIIFLFLVVLEFAEAIPLVITSIESVLFAFMMLIFSYFFILIGKNIYQTKSTTIFIVGVVSATEGLFFTILFAILFIGSYILKMMNPSELSLYYMMAGLFVSSVLGVIAVAQERSKDRSQRRATT